MPSPASGARRDDQRGAPITRPLCAPKGGTGRCGAPEAAEPEFARFCDGQLALVRDFLRAGKDFYGVQTARVERLARTPRLASE